MLKQILEAIREKRQENIKAKLLDGMFVERDPWKKKQEYVLARVIAQRNGIRQ